MQIFKRWYMCKRVKIHLSKISVPNWTGARAAFRSYFSIYAAMSARSLFGVCARAREFRFFHQLGGHCYISFHLSNFSTDDWWKEMIFPFFLSAAGSNTLSFWWISFLFSSNNRHELINLNSNQKSSIIHFSTDAILDRQLKCQHRKCFQKPAKLMSTTKKKNACSKMMAKRNNPLTYAYVDILFYLSPPKADMCFSWFSQPQYVRYEWGGGGTSDKPSWKSRTNQREKMIVTLV